MRVELEDNLNNNLIRFFKETNKYIEEFEDIQSLFGYLSRRMKIDGFKCHQQYSFSLKKTMIIYQKVEYINNLTISSTINVIVEEEILKIIGVTKNEVKSYNEIIF